MTRVLMMVAMLAMIAGCVPAGGADNESGEEDHPCTCEVPKSGDFCDLDVTLDEFEAQVFEAAPCYPYKEDRTNPQVGEVYRWVCLETGMAVGWWRDSPRAHRLLDKDSGVWVECMSGEQVGDEWQGVAEVNLRVDDPVAPTRLVRCNGECCDG